MIVNRIYNHYSILNKIYLAIRVFKTKIICSKARIIRHGFSIRGKSMIDLGKSLTTGCYCRLEAFETGKDNRKKMILGKRIQLNDYVHISAIESVKIGDDVLIASHVYISDNSHGSYKGDKDDTPPDIPPIKRPYYVSPVNIGSKVWLGEGVIVMPGVTIGDGAIVGAHSIVNKNIPANTIAVGSPAKIIKRWDENNNIWINI